MTEVVFRVVKEFDVVRVVLTKEGEQRIKLLSAEGKCLACERVLDASEKIVCGCCESCDQTQRYAMRKGFVTLNSLLKSGERKVAQTGGRKPKSDYAKKLLGKR